jgi:UDPglucose 6-dehydrogenase
MEAVSLSHKNSNKMKIAIIGSGYVGLVTGACFSEVGIDVVCVDVDQQKIDDLKRGIVPIYEPGLEAMIKRNTAKGRLNFTSDVASSIKACEVVFISVGTPPDEDGSADLKHVIAVARDCGKYMDDYTLVVTKSTVPVGTSMKVRQAIQEEMHNRGAFIEFDVASNPEFLKEGAAINDFLKPDRIVLGTDSKKAEKLLSNLYKPFTLNGHPIIFMDIISAEMTKYAANAMLATKISFINDIANLCEMVGADVNNVRKGIGSDSRIGNKFIYPGIGYGGSCFPKDVKALIKTASDYDYNLRVLTAVEAVNQDQKSVLFHKIFNYFNGNLKGKKVAIWGLSFKPHTDDMREAPSIEMVRRLLEAGANVSVYDPVALSEAKHHFGNTVNYCSNQYEVLENADCLAVLTEWSEFRIPNFNMITKLLNAPAIFDGRNIYDLAEMKRLGIDYFCIGVKTTNKKSKLEPSFIAEYQ